MAIAERKELTIYDAKIYIGDVFIQSVKEINLNSGIEFKEISNSDGRPSGYSRGKVDLSGDMMFDASDLLAFHTQIGGGASYEAQFERYVIRFNLIQTEDCAAFNTIAGVVFNNISEAWNRTNMHEVAKVSFLYTCRRLELRGSAFI